MCYRIMMIPEHMSAYIKDMCTYIKSVNQRFRKEDLHSSEVLVQLLDLLVVENVFPSLQDHSEVNQVVLA
jgi:hypothetical protein